MKLYYFPTSHWSRIVSLGVRELGLHDAPGCDYELVDITQGASFEPDYLRLNPRGVVPTLDDDGEIVWDSRDIAKHLDRKYGEGRLWLGHDAPTQRWIERLHDFPVMLLSYAVWVQGERGETSEHILADKIARARRLAEQHPDLREQYLRKASFFEGFSHDVDDEAYVARQSAIWAGVLDELGELLGSERAWIGGDAPCFADMILVATLVRLVDLERLHDWHEDPAHPLRAYFDRWQSRPSFRWVFIEDPQIPARQRPRGLS